MPKEEELESQVTEGNDAVTSDDGESQSGLEIMQEHFQTTALMDAVGDEVPTDDAGILAMLRTFPNHESYDDATLLEMWKSTTAEPGATPGTEGDVTKPDIPVYEPKGWTVNVDGNPVEDLSGLTALELLQGGKFTYKANQQDQIRDFNEIVRNAQLGHFNERRYNELNTDVGMLGRQLDEALERIAKYEETEKTWYQALQNPEYYQQLAEEYKNQLGQPQPEVVGPTEAELELEGNKIYAEQLRPHLMQVADYYGLDEQGLEDHFAKWFDGQPKVLLTPDRIQAYLYGGGLYQEIEMAGFEPRYDAEGKLIETKEAVPEVPVTPVVDNAESEALKKEVAALKEVVQNLQRQDTVKKKKGKAPSSGKGEEVGSGVSDSPADKADMTAAEFKDWLRS
jgi:hypothetical protein